MTITGEAGHIRWGYFLAASVREWTIVRESGAMRLTATIVSRDAVRITQRPLDFIVTHRRGVWTWPITELQIDGDTITASLSEKDSRVESHSSA